MNRFRFKSLHLVIVCLIMCVVNSPVSAALLGTHYTQEELDIWKIRVTQSKYSSEWDRITKNANSFKNNPSAQRYYGYTREMANRHNSMCVPKNIGGDDQKALEGMRLGFDIRDAAFYSLIKDDVDLRNKVIDELKIQIQQEGANFANKEKWCPIFVDGHPTFITAEWTYRLLLAYDYVRPLMNDADKKKVDEWFRGAGEFFRANANQEGYTPHRDHWFTDRDKGTLSELGLKYLNDCDSGKKTHIFGPLTCRLNELHNNRMASQWMFVGAVGIMLNNTNLKKYAAWSTKEYIKYGIFPNGGGTYELRRSVDASAETGYGYNAATLFSYTMIADLFARHGDTSLYDYEPTDGTIYNQGKKSLKVQTDFLIDITHDRLNIYKADGSEHIIDRIDSVHPDRNAYKAYEHWFAVSNIYWKDDVIRDSYQILGPENALSDFGAKLPDMKLVDMGLYLHMGGGTRFPSIRILYMDMEEQVNPYPTIVYLDWLFHYLLSK